MHRPGSSKTPLFVGIGAAALAAVAVVWWLMSGGAVVRANAGHAHRAAHRALHGRRRPLTG